MTFFKLFNFFFIQMCLKCVLKQSTDVVDSVLNLALQVEQKNAGTIISQIIQSLVYVFTLKKKNKKKKTDQIGVPLNESYLVYEETRFLTVFD